MTPIVIAKRSALDGSSESTTVKDGYDRDLSSIKINKNIKLEGK